MNKSMRFIYTIAFSMVLIVGTVKSAPPGWWTDPAASVVEEGGTVEENYAPANLGQLKNMALKAKLHLDANLVGEAGSAIDALVNGFEPRAGQGYTQQQIDAFIAENYAPINLGQLKAVAKPFYDRLQAAGFDTKASLIGHGFTNVWVSPHNWSGYYPWNPATAVADNYAPANIGQLKMVFGFDLAGFDTDKDGLPDAWEMGFFGNLNAGLDDDIDGDGLTNAQELSQGSDPNNYYSQGGDEIAPTISIVGGDQQGGLPDEYLEDALAVVVRNSANSQILANAPVSFSVSSGGGGLSALAGGSLPSGSIGVVTDSSGIARAYYKQGGTLSVTSEIEAKAGISAPVVFGSITTTNAVTFSPGRNERLRVKAVQIKTNVPSGVIHYTLDGQEPTDSDPTVASGSLVRVPIGAQLRAAAWLSGSRVTGVKAADYPGKGRVVIGYRHSFAIAQDGDLWSWGYNEYGQLGIGTSGNQWLPVKVESLPGIVDVGLLEASSVILDDQGEVWSVGHNANGRLGDGTTTNRTDPVKLTGLTDVVAVAAGVAHCLALKADGTVWAWGYNGYGQLGTGTNSDSSVPVQVLTSGGALSGVVAIAAGGYSSFAVMADGSLMAWGSSYSGQLGAGASVAYDVATAISSVSDVVDIGVGDSYAIVLKADGTVWGTGYNGYGQLGNGSTSQSLSFTQVPALTDVVSISAGENHTAAIKADGSVLTWGYNSEGQLGDGTTVRKLNPFTVSNLDGYISVGAGRSTIAINQSGDMVGFGSNSHGQIGDGTATNRGTPVAIEELTLGNQVARPVLSPPGGKYLKGQAVTISCPTAGAAIHYTTTGAEPTELDPVFDSGSTVAILRTGLLRAKAFKTGLLPSDPGNAAYVIGTQISASWRHSLAVEPDGRMWAWGYGQYGQLGDGYTFDQSLPKNVEGLTNMRDVAAGAYHSLAVDAFGNVWSFGSNGNGQLGDGTRTERRRPVKLVGFTGARAVAAGFAHGLVLKNDGTVWAFGRNNVNQLGDGTSAESIVPVQVVGLSGVVAIAAVEDTSFALKADGTLWSFGSGNFTNGGYGKGPRATRNGSISKVVAIGASLSHLVALKADGTVWSVGNNSYGQLGTGDTISSNYFVRVSGISDVVAVGASSYCSAAIKANGDFLAWGLNSDGKMGDGANASRLLPTVISGFSNAVNVSMNDHTLVVRNNGAETLWAAGKNDRGQLGIDNKTNSNVPVMVLSNLRNTDTDRDGVPDWIEVDLGTSVNLSDSNGDGVADGISLQLGIDPLDLDTDGDGVSNIDEIARGTDPLEVDTDGDGYDDSVDAFPLDPTRHDAPTGSGGDTTPPQITLEEPLGATEL